MRLLVRLCGAAGVFGWSYPALLDAAVQRIAAANRGIGQASARLRATSAAAGSDSEGKPMLVAGKLAWSLSLVGGCSPQVWEALMDLAGWEVEVCGGVRELSERPLRQIHQVLHAT
jgi:hypothetical protein